jgi:integrase
LKNVLPDMQPWTIHDLRRTARSLMSRAGVRPDIAERVLGHAIAGVEGVYDRHDYFEQKADALIRLNNEIESILKPNNDNIVPLKRNYN